MMDRHDKWVRVEPGHVIPVGQPFRIEFDAKEAGYVDGRYGTEYPGPNREKEVVLRDDTDEWFVDSSWKPPLVLPTEPTWGIVVNKITGPRFGKWVKEGGLLHDRYNKRNLTADWSLDFIPLTDEQVQRIEAAQS